MVEHREHLGALRERGDGEHVALAGPIQHEAQGRYLVARRGDVGGTAIDRPRPQAADEVLGVAPPQVAVQLRHDDVVGSTGRPVAEPMQQLVVAIARGAEREPRLAPGCAQTSGDLGEAVDARLVVRVVEHDHPFTEHVDVRAARVRLGVGQERAQPLHDRLPGDADRERRRRSRHRVVHVLGRDARERHRYLLEVDERARATARELREMPVEHREDPASVGESFPKGRMAGIEGAHERPATRTSVHGQHPRVVGVQHVPAVGLRDGGDRGLDLRELVDRVDAVQAEVIGRDVRDDRDVVVAGADAAEQDAPPGGLEDRDVDARLRERHLRAAEPGVVAGFHQHVVVEDAIGRGVRDALSARAHDVGDQAHGRGLAVRAGDGDHGDHGIGHGRRRPRVDRPDSLGRLGREARERPAGAHQIAHDGGDLAGERLGRVASPPRERDHDRVVAWPGAPPCRQLHDVPLGRSCGSRVLRPAP